MTTVTALIFRIISVSIFNWYKQAKKSLSCVMVWKWQDLYRMIKPFHFFPTLW